MAVLLAVFLADTRLAGAFALTGALALTALAGVARTGLAATERCCFASARPGARHATEMSNGKTCARMRFISSIGFRLRSWLRGSGRPPSRGAATKTAL